MEHQHTVAHCLFKLVLLIVRVDRILAVIDGVRAARVNCTGRLLADEPVDEGALFRALVLDIILDGDNAVVVDLLLAVDDKLELRTRRFAAAFRKADEK